MKDCIVVVLSKVIRFLAVAESPREFDFDGHQLLGQFESNNNGFIDWLRDNSSKIIGVRWSAYDDKAAQLVSGKLAYLCNVEVDNNGAILIFFGDVQNFDESTSCDQSFGDNNFYMSSTGLCAMSFSTTSIDSCDDLTWFDPSVIEIKQI